MKIVSLDDFQEFSLEKMKKTQCISIYEVFCDVYCLEPKQEQKGHVHADQDKVYLVIEGSGIFQIGGESHVLGQGQGTMAPAGEEHGVINHTDQRLRILVFMAPNPS